MSGSESFHSRHTFPPNICFSTPTMLRIDFELSRFLTPFGHMYSIRVRSATNSCTRLSSIAATAREPNRGSRYFSKWLPMVSWDDGLKMGNRLSFHHEASEAKVLAPASLR